jgi:hypothetical protein
MRRDPCAVSYEPMSQSDHQKNNRCRRRRAIRTLEALILSFAAFFLQFGCAEEPTPFHGKRLLLRTISCAGMKKYAFDSVSL